MTTTPFDRTTRAAALPLACAAATGRSSPGLMEQGERARGHARRICQLARPGCRPVTSGSVDEIVR